MSKIERVVTLGARRTRAQAKYQAQKWVMYYKGKQRKGAVAYRRALDLQFS